MRPLTTAVVSGAPTMGLLHTAQVVAAAAAAPSAPTPIRPRTGELVRRSAAAAGANTSAMGLRIRIYGVPNTPRTSDTHVVRIRQELRERSIDVGRSGGGYSTRWSPHRYLLPSTHTGTRG